MTPTWMIEDYPLSAEVAEPELSADTPPPSAVPPPAGAGRAARRRRMVEVAAVLVLFGVTWLLDEPIYRFLDGLRPYPRVVRDDLTQPFRICGQYLTVVFVVAAIAALEPRRRGQVLALLATVALASVWVPPAKLIAGRVRPNQARGEMIFLGPEGALLTHRNQSFPSGHTATAVAFAVCLAMMYPRGRWVFAAIALGAALSRILDVQHFPSDVVAGAAPAYWLTPVIYRSGWLRRWAGRWDRRLAPRADIREIRRWDTPG